MKFSGHRAAVKNWNEFENSCRNRVFQGTDGTKPCHGDDVCVPCRQSGVGHCGACAAAHIGDLFEYPYRSYWSVVSMLLVMQNPALTVIFAVHWRFPGIPVQDTESKTSSREAVV